MAVRKALALYEAKGNIIAAEGVCPAGRARTRLNALIRRPHMDPNFYGELNLKSDGQTIVAGGPCNWQNGDAWAEVKDVTVTQGSVVASSGGSTTVRRTPTRTGRSK